MDEQSSAILVKFEYVMGMVAGQFAALQAENERLTGLARCPCQQVDVHQERCTCCGQPSPVGFTVPDGVWLAVAGQKDGTVYCVMCFAAKADALFLDWSADIQFWPVSARAALAPIDRGRAPEKAEE